MKHQLTNLFLQIAPIPNIEINKFQNRLKVRKVLKGEYFIKEGDIPRKFAFNCEGLFRYFYIDKNGNESTKSFLMENDFLISYSAMYQNRASFFFIEAMEDSLILEIDYLHWLKTVDSHPSWLSIANAMLSKGFCKKEDREREFLLLDATERYLSFLDRYDGLDTRIKQHYIASYLGITPVALSRIRKKLGRINPG